jgi:hypothetical protein
LSRKVGEETFQLILRLWLDGDGRFSCGNVEVMIALAIVVLVGRTEDLTHPGDEI